MRRLRDLRLRRNVGLVDGKCRGGEAAVPLCASLSSSFLGFRDSQFLSFRNGITISQRRRMGTIMAKWE
jgi:hypothetical protein